MEKFKYLIIGGGVAGVTAAETIRQNDPTGSVAVISDEPQPLYSRVMLSKPNFFLGKIPFDQVYLKGQKWYQDNKVNFLGGKIAVDVDTKHKTLILSDGHKVHYEKLLIATGVRVRTLNLPGSNKKGIHYLRTLDDGKSIMEHIKTAKRAITIGGGFISFEMADLLKLAGLDTTMLLRESYFWEPVLDQTSAQMLEDAITRAGIKVLKNVDVAEIVGGESVEGVVLKDGTKLPCDMLVCGIGVVNPIDWLKRDGVATNRGILANEYLETNIPDVWAAGDIAEYKDVLLEENVQMGNWVNGREQGRIAGLNMTKSSSGLFRKILRPFDILRRGSGQAAQGKEPFKFVSFYTTQGFGVSVAFVGDVTPAIQRGSTSLLGSEVEPRDIIPRGPVRVPFGTGGSELSSYGRLIVDKKGELVGATLINRTAELTIIAKLIENNVNVSAYRTELSDPTFDLNSLLPKK